jgi:hypothetical protein
MLFSPSYNLYKFFELIVILIEARKQYLEKACLALYFDILQLFYFTLTIHIIYIICIYKSALQKNTLKVAFITI